LVGRKTSFSQPFAGKYDSGFGFLAVEITNFIYFQRPIQDNLPFLDGIIETAHYKQMEFVLRTKFEFPKLTQNHWIPSSTVRKPDQSCDILDGKIQPWWIWFHEQ
jgi:hypothetical protein